MKKMKIMMKIMMRTMILTMKMMKSSCQSYLQKEEEIAGTCQEVAAIAPTSCLRHLMDQT